MLLGQQLIGVAEQADKMLPVCGANYVQVCMQKSSNLSCWEPTAWPNLGDASENL